MKYPSITFDRALTTAQLELKEADWWGKHHQKWPKNGLASLKSSVFAPSVGRRPYRVSICAIAGLPVKPDAKVIFLGGSPMVGKTTIARIIASRLQYGCISADDIGAAITSVTGSASHPAFHYMGDRDYREYYIESSRDELIRDINSQHEALWPALKTIFHNHSTWGTAAIIEGWALRPSYVSQLPGDISGLFLVSDDDLIEQRTRSSDFSEGASDEETMIQRYLERSLWYNAQLREQVARLGLEAISISLEMRPEEIADECMRVLVVKEKP